MKKIRVLSLFSGIGAFEKALEKLKVDYELVNYCEIDKYASQMYSKIHNTNEELNLGDITKVDVDTLDDDIDVYTWGFPCTDISICGKQAGFVDTNGEQTQSGLFYEGLRILQAKRPKLSIIENVKNLTSKKFKNEFDIVLNSLEEAGYNSYYKVLKASDYGVPQARERVFIVSIRKDIDNGMFEFQSPIKLAIKLKDLLEDEVDEKYYLSNEKLDKIAAWKAQQKPLKRVIGNNSICPTLTARGAGEMHSGMIIYSDKLDDTADLRENYHDMNIRFITPLESFRLMGFDDSDYEKIKNFPKRELYRVAGNSIVVNVLYYIFKSLKEVGVFDVM